MTNFVTFGFEGHEGGSGSHGVLSWFKNNDDSNQNNNDDNDNSDNTNHDDDDRSGPHPASPIGQS